MKAIEFDCLKSDGYKYSSLHGTDKLGNPDGCEYKKPELREKDELFAFKWPNLPESVQDAVAERIRHMYGLKLPHEDVLRIFKCLVARDVEIPMPWIEVEKGKKLPPKKFYIDAFDEKTFKTKIRIVEGYPSEHVVDAYYVHDYIGRANESWFQDKDGYTMLKAWNSNLMSTDRSEARLYSYEKAEKTCIECAKNALLEYIGGHARKGNTAFDVLERLNGHDWTKKGTIKLTKADFMAQPRGWNDRYSDWRNVDWRLLDVIEEYKLSPEVDQKFIDWIASGCRATKKGAKKSKLSAFNFNIVTAVDFPELTRANVVDCYHGLPGDIVEKLEPGSAFTCGRNGTEYIVFKTAMVDHEKVIAYAKAGTVIDDEGFIDRGSILLGLDEQSIKECWDCLFDVNRQGRRKKILKVMTVKKAVKGGDGK